MRDVDERLMHGFSGIVCANFRVCSGVDLDHEFVADRKRRVWIVPQEVDRVQVRRHGDVEVCRI